jgi:hypothetical protein
LGSHDLVQKDFKSGFAEDDGKDSGRVEDHTPSGP